MCWLCEARRSFGIEGREEVDWIPGSGSANPAEPPPQDAPSRPAEAMPADPDPVRARPDRPRPAE